MGDKSKKPVIGLLGGMCSGKSTAAAELAKMGCSVIDADAIIHQLLEVNAIRAKIVRVFGKEILDDKGGVNRSELANRVFGDPGKLKKLTDIIHPPALAQVEQLIDEQSNNSAVRAIVLDMPLLVEVGWEKRCDHIIFMDCKPPIRLQRAKKAGSFDADELKIRENMQISLDNKKRIADNIVDNNSDLSGLSKQIAEVFSRIMNNG